MFFACAACQSITLEPRSTLPNGTAGSPYNGSITASGGVEPYNYSVSSGTLPAGLTLDSTTGALSGTPEMAGTFNFTMTATGSGRCPGSRDYALVIACRTINVTPANPNLPPGSAGAAYNRIFTANGGLAPYSFSVTAGTLLHPGDQFDNRRFVGRADRFRHIQLCHPGNRQHRMRRLDPIRPDHQLPGDSNQPRQSESAERHGGRAFQ